MMSMPGPVRSEFYTFSPVRSVWSGPKNIPNRYAILMFELLVQFGPYNYMLITLVENVVYPIKRPYHVVRAKLMFQY